jgi:hypothetical protein
VPLDFAKRYFLGVGGVEELAVYVAGAELFDFGKVGDEEVIDPVYNLVAGGIVPVVDHVSLVLIL